MSDSVDQDQLAKRHKGEGMEPPTTIRILIDNRFVGGLIGKQGTTINKFRGDSGCSIDVSDSAQGARHRVVTIQGSGNGVVVALSLIVQRLYEQSQTNRVVGMATDDEGKQEHDVSITLLVANSIVGALIGRGGSRIAETRQATGASIKISERPLDGSTEKSVQVRGSTLAVQQALSLIMLQLQEQGDRPPRVPYIPHPEYNQLYGAAAAYSNLAPGRDYYAQTTMAAYGDRRDPAYNRDLQAHSGFDAGGVTYGQVGQAQQLVVPVPETLIGAVIGRGGKNINEVRQRSGATIKVGQKEVGATNRQIIISGSAQQNELAVALLHQRTLAAANESAEAAGRMSDQRY